MEIKKTNENGTLNVAISGRLDTTTAPELETNLSEDIKTCKELVFDFKDLEYVSSAGLRVLLACQKTMNKQGAMSIKNVRDEIYEVFDMTGFLDILNVQK